MADRPVEGAVLPITGYLSRLSARPGDTLTAHVSLREAGGYRAHLMRMICADPLPDGPGRRYEDRSDVFDRHLQGQSHGVHLGSYVEVLSAPRRDPSKPCTWTALVRPGLVDRVQCVASEAGPAGPVALAIKPGGVTAEFPTLTGPVRLSVDAVLSARRWYRVWASADPSTGQALVACQLARCDGCASLSEPAAVMRGEATALVLPPGGGVLLIGARVAGWPVHHLNGRIEDPAVVGSWVDQFPDPLATLASLPGPLLAGWDFAQGIGGSAVTDTGPQRCHGAAVNLPTRGVVGARWTGAETCWRHAPQDYAAIHFHEDDLEDCAWPASFDFMVATGLRSGCYLLHLSCPAGEDWLPFYVLPPRDGPRAAVAFLAATFTYLAYANHARGNADAAYKERVAAWGAYPFNPDDYPAYAASTYNRHPDGSGVSLSSRLRPILTMRPGYITFNDKRGSGTRHFTADSHLLGWLEAKGIAYDVITDEDLDDEGAALLEPYAAVLTGSHPEYHTARMLDALQSYTAGRGRLAYLGGNGFYWRIARDAARPHVIEVRRAEGGVRAWPAEPGEYHHQLDGQLGGLWRRNRRPPQQLVGIGFSGQGLFEGTHYRRLPASFEARFAWMFAGISQDVLGDYGLSGGGAAGFEFDRADPSQGTPGNAVVLARSEDPPASAEPVLEELLSPLTTVTGEPRQALVRAEIVYFATPGGGEVFSTGSITFCGSLWRDGFEGPVSLLLENVVRHFGRPRDTGAAGCAADRQQERAGRQDRL